MDTEREEKLKKAGEKAAKDEKYAQWGRGYVCITFHTFEKCNSDPMKLIKVYLYFKDGSGPDVSAET